MESLKQRRGLGFQAKLLLVFVAVLGVFLSLILFFHYQSEKVMIRNSVANHRDMVNIVHFSTQTISTERHVDQEELERFLHEMVRKNSVFEVSVIDFNNQVIASSDASKVGGQATDPGQGVEVREQTEAGIENDKARFQVRIPLVKDKQVEGIVEISVLLNSLRAHLGKLSRKQALLFLAALVVSFAVFSLFLRHLHRPFRRLASAAKSIANGDYNVQLDEEAAGEEGEMAAAFNHMARRLREQRDMEERLAALERRAILTELGANLAHEIRNPLNLMNLTLHHLGKTCSPENAARAAGFHRAIGSLKTEVAHLDRIVTDFLTLGKPDRLSRRRFRLRELVDEVAVRLGHKLDDKALRVDLDCPEGMEIHADQEQMRLVLLNLFLNCIEAVPERSSIEFVARKSPAGAVECTVADKGPGFGPGDPDQVFEPYYTKTPGGTGLGLTLVRSIIENHGGEIRAVNRPMGGAEFRFSVPAEV
jgi:signal transduction histidine kinase